MVAHGLSHEIVDLRGGETRLPVCPAQMVHTPDRLRDGSVSGLRR
jgi:hypothetical protein